MKIFLIFFALNFILLALYPTNAILRKPNRYENIYQEALVGDILNRVDKTLQNSTAFAAGQGNYLINRTREELNLLLINAFSLLDGSLNKTVADLSRENQRIISTLIELSDKIDQGLGNVVGITDNLVLDINNLVPSILEEKKFILQRVEGLVQLHKNSEYHIVLTGTNLSRANTEFKSQIKQISIEEQVLQKTDFSQVNGEGNHQIRIGFKQELINAYFTDNPRAIKAILEIGYSTKKNTELSGWVYWWNKLMNKEVPTEWVEHNISMPINIFLYPKKAGTFTLHYKIPTQCEKWIDGGIIKGIPITTGNHHWDDDDNYVAPGNYVIEVAVSDPNLYKITGITRYICTPSKDDACDFTTRDPDQDKVTSEKASTVVTVSSHTVTLTLEASQQQKNVINSFQPQTKDLELLYDDEIAIEMPKEAILDKITGKIVGGDQLTVHFPYSNDKIIKVREAEPVGNTKKVMLKMEKPTLL